MSTEQDAYAAVTDPRIIAVLDVLAPVETWSGQATGRDPIFEWGHETTPTPEEMIELAGRIVDVLHATEEPMPPRTITAGPGGFILPPATIRAGDRIRLEGTDWLIE